MNPLDEKIVERLTGAFIVGATVDPVETAKALKKRFPEVDELELAQAIRRVANGIGMRIKEASGASKPREDRGSTGVRARPAVLE